MKFSPRTRTILISIFFLLALGAGLAYYQWGYLPAQAAAEPQLQTTRVRTGDIRITADGAGSLAPAAEVRLSFRSSGVLSEVLVAPGDEVTAGQVLARLDDASARLQLEQAQLNLNALVSPYATAEAEKALADALLGLEKAEANRQAQQKGSRASESTIQGAQADLVLAEAKAASAWAKYEPLAGRAEDDTARATALAQYASAAAARDALAEKLEWYLGEPDASTQASLDADVAVAAARVEAARQLLAALNGKALDATSEMVLNSDLTRLRQAYLSLSSAQLALENTVLIAPWDGTVTAVSAAVGETVSSGPFITLAALDQPLVRFYLEESDLARVQPGSPVNFILDAYPDHVLSGTVLRVEPVLATEDGTRVITAWASLEQVQGLALLSGMAVEVEVVAGEALRTLLVPNQALRELGPDSYAVFVVQEDGKLKLTPVTVGLRDFANAQILSGLSAGDVVSTGTVETK
jgi:HlyD family secretion protein